MNSIFGKKDHFKELQALAATVNQCSDPPSSITGPLSDPSNTTNTNANAATFSILLLLVILLILILKLMLMLLIQFQLLQILK